MATHLRPTAKSHQRDATEGPWIWHASTRSSQRLIFLNLPSFNLVGHSNGQQLWAARESTARILHPPAASRRKEKGSGKKHPRRQGKHMRLPVSLLQTGRKEIIFQHSRTPGFGLFWQRQCPCFRTTLRGSNLHPRTSFTRSRCFCNTQQRVGIGSRAVARPQGTEGKRRRREQE